MRRLNRKQTLKIVKELDAFPKIPESYVETTSIALAEKSESHQQNILQHHAKTLQTIYVIVASNLI